MGIRRSTVEDAGRQHESLGSELVAMAAGRTKAGKAASGELPCDVAHGGIAWLIMGSFARGLALPGLYPQQTRVGVRGRAGKSYFCDEARHRARRLGVTNAYLQPLRIDAHELEVGGRSMRWQSAEK